MKGKRALGREEFDSNRLRRKGKEPRRHNKYLKFLRNSNCQDRGVRSKKMNKKEIGEMERRQTSGMRCSHCGLRGMCHLLAPSLLNIYLSIYLPFPLFLLSLFYPYPKKGTAFETPDLHLLVLLNLHSMPSLQLNILGYYFYYSNFTIWINQLLLHH